MSPVPAASWSTVRVYGTWHNLDGTLKEGSYKVTIPVRVTNAADDVIIPAGIFATGALNTTPGVPSLDLNIPATDDPDNTPNGWQVTVAVTFTNATGETYILDLPQDGGPVNLRTVVLPANVPTPAQGLIKGVPGGVAGLDADGDVVDAYGIKVTGSGGGAVDSVNGYTGTVVLGTADITGLQATLNSKADDADITALQTSLAGKADTADVTNLQTTVDGKADAAHGHDATEITTGQLGIERLPAGGTLVVDKAKEFYGAAGSWPTSRPTARIDICVIWIGDTDPGTIALAGDIWKVTP